MNNNAIYLTILAQAVRFALRAVAGYLAFIGITGEQQSQFVEVTVGVIVPLLLVGFAELWSYLQKRYAGILFKTALQSPASATPTEVKLEASEKTVAPVAY